MTEFIQKTVQIVNLLSKKPHQNFAQRIDINKTTYVHLTSYHNFNHQKITGGAELIQFTHFNPTTNKLMSTINLSLCFDNHKYRRYRICISAPKNEKEIFSTYRCTKKYKRNVIYSLTENFRKIIIYRKHPYYTSRFLYLTNNKKELLSFLEDLQLELI